MRVAILTGTVRPQVQVALSDVGLRVQHYSAGLRAWQSLIGPTVDRVVFVENSDFDLSTLSVANEAGSQMTLLNAPRPSEELLARHGKGAAELKMIEWVAETLSLSESDVLIKATGRHTPLNAKGALAGLPDTPFVRARLKLDLTWMDTRLFAMQVGVFRSWFAGTSEMMHEPTRLIEHVFAGCLLSALGQGAVEFSRFPAAPRLRGVSGTTGIAHHGPKWLFHQTIETGWRRFAPNGALWV